MAKVKYDTSDVPAGGGESAQPGVYDAKIREANLRQEDGKNDIEVILDIEGGEYRPIWTYIHLGDASAWKLAEFVKALGLPKAGSLDTAKLVGESVRIKVTADEWGGDYRARVGAWLRSEDAVVDEEEAEELDAKAAVEEEGEEEDYSEWETSELKEEISERGLRSPRGRANKAKLIAVLEADDAKVVAEAEPEEEEEESVAGEDYNEWELDELKAEATERGIMGNISGRKSKDKLVEALLADDGGPPEAEADDDYDEWDEDELKSEIKDRDLEITGRKTADKMIAALRADDREEAF